VTKRARIGAGYRGRKTSSRCPSFGEIEQLLKLERLVLAPERSKVGRTSLALCLLVFG